MNLTKSEVQYAKALGELHDNLIRPFSVLLRKYEKRERAVDADGNYMFVPALGQEVAVNFLKIKKLLGSANLLDIGSGIGNIVALANSLGFKARGTDINPLYCELGNPYNNVTEQDIFKLEDLKDIDVIFVYRPLHDMAKLFTHIEQVALSPTILYSFGVIPTIGTPILDNPFIVQL